MNRMRLSLLWAAALSSVVSGSLNGQDDVSNALFKSGPISSSNQIVPNVGSNVNMYTGKANIAIPLCEVQAEGLSIPITLSYQTGGIKVTDITGNVGLGWNFSMGAKISRSMSGTYSDLVNVVNNGVTTNRNGYLNGYDPGYKASTWDRWVSGMRNKGNNSERLDLWDERFLGTDGRPDIFFFEIPGASGRFILDLNGKTHTIPKQNLEIEWSAPFREVECLTVTDDNGYEYYFGSGEYSRVYYDEYPSAYYLIKIVKDGRDILNCTYEEGGAYYYALQDKIYTLEYEGSTLKSLTSKDKNFYQLFVLRTKCVKSIRTENQEIVFSYSDYRENFPRIKLLQSIDVKYNGERTKTIVLDYDEFQNAAPKLKGIKERIKDADLEPVYNFEYEESVNIPKWDTPSYDYWGYYNGKANLNNCPSISVRDSLRGNEYTYDGADRSPDFNYARANSLTKIKYASGGYKEFEYEPHVTHDNKIVGGLRIKSIKECTSSGTAASLVKYEYKKRETGLNSGRCFSYPQPTAILDYRAGGVIPGSKTIVKYLVYERYPFQLEDYDGAAIVYPEAQEIYANGGYRNIAFTSFDDYGDRKPQITVVGADGTTSDHARRDYRMLPNTSYWWARGMVKVSEVYDASDELQSRERFEYELLGIEKKIPDRIPFITMGGMNEYYAQQGNFTGIQFKLSTNYWISQSIKLISHFVEQGKSNIANETHYNYDDQHNLPVQTFYNDAKNQIVTYIKYPFDFDLSNGVEGSPEVEAIRKLQEQCLHVPIETYITKNGKFIKGQISAFKEVPLHDGASGIKLWRTYDLVINQPILDYAPATVTNGVLTYDPRYIMVNSIEHYDSKGNATNIHTLLTGKNSSFIYDKFGNKIAEINNAVYTEDVAHRQNEVYYTSFENDDSIPGIIETDKAKTGSSVMSDLYDIDLQNFKPGSYKLSYWKSTDSGENWVKITRDVQIDSGTLNFAIGENTAFGYWIDEVRLQSCKCQNGNFNI